MAKVIEAGTCLLKRLSNNNFWKNVTILAGSTATGQLLSFLTTPIVTRLYKPEDFGLVAIYSSVLGFLMAFVCLSYQYAILTPEDEVESANLLALCFIIAIGFSVAFMLVVYLGGRRIAQQLGEPKIARYLWLIPLSTVLVGGYTGLNFWAIRKKAFGQIAQTKVSQVVSSVVAKIGLGMFGLKPFGLFLGTLVAESAGLFSLARFAWKENQQAFTSITWSNIKRVAKRYIRFPLLTTPTAFINAAGTNLPIVLLTTLYGTEVTGWFNLAQRLTLIPISLIGVAIGQVYLGEITALAHTDPQKMYDLFIKTSKRLAMLSVLPALVFMFGGIYFTPVLLGKEWKETGAYLQFLSVSFVTSFVATPVSRVFSVLERQDVALIWNIVRLILVTGSLYIANILGFSARIAVLFFAISMMFVDVCRIFLVSMVIRTAGRNASRGG